MKGGTLLASRAVNHHADYKKKLQNLGFWNVTVTAAVNEQLNKLIKELHPNLLIMGSGFYKSATPYRIGILRRKFKKLNIAVVSITNYPADLGMKFISNGANSYINYNDGSEQFYSGLEKLSRGKNYISPSIMERINCREELPPPAIQLTEREIEVLRLICNGFTRSEISVELSVSKRTVDFHKAELFNRLGTRNENELIRVALYLGIIKVDELDFYGGDYVLPPIPEGTNNEELGMRNEE